MSRTKCEKLERKLKRLEKYNQGIMSLAAKQSVTLRRMRILLRKDTEART